VARHDVRTRSRLGSRFGSAATRATVLAPTGGARPAEEMRLVGGTEVRTFRSAAVLVDAFGAWQRRHGVGEDKAERVGAEADLALDWKWAYADGDLVWWRTEHVSELPARVVPAQAQRVRHRRRVHPRLLGEVRGLPGRRQPCWHRDRRRWTSWSAPPSPRPVRFWTPWATPRSSAWPGRWSPPPRSSAGDRTTECEEGGAIRCGRT